MSNFSFAHLTACEDLLAIEKLLERSNDRERLREELFAILI